MEPDASALLYAVDFRECTALVGLHPEDLGEVFVKALRRAGATVLHKLIHVISGSGLTCVLILSESHAALHTWPETGTVHLDIFSCSSRLKSMEAIVDAASTAKLCAEPSDGAVYASAGGGPTSSADTTTPATMIALVRVKT